MIINTKNPLQMETKSFLEIQTVKLILFVYKKGGKKSALFIELRQGFYLL